ncbi:MAG: hypothetical protein ABH845_05470 [Candidatus Omnitrophota bacterium]
MKKILLGLSGLFLMISFCEAGTLVMEEDAKDRIGKPEEHFLSQPYSVLLLERKTRNPIHLEPIDALIFNTGGGKFRKIRAQDRNQVVVLDTMAGFPGDRVTKDNLATYLGLAEANHMTPFVFEGEDGKELAVIYVDPYNICYAYQTPKGIRIQVKGAPFQLYRSLEDKPIRLRNLFQ